jgi:hypothetical protein
MCPFTKVKFASKSYEAYKLRQGLSYTDFLGLPKITTTKKMLRVPEPMQGEGVVLQLPQLEQRLPINNDVENANGENPNTTNPLRLHIVPIGHGESDRDYVEPAKANSLLKRGVTTMEEPITDPWCSSQEESLQGNTLLPLSGDAPVEELPDINPTSPSRQLAIQPIAVARGEGEDSQPVPVLATMAQEKVINAVAEDQPIRVKPNSKTIRVGSLEIEDQGVPLWITPGGEVTYSNPKAPYTKPPSDKAIKACI